MQLYMVCAIVDYKRQVYFCNAVYEKFTYVISMGLINEQLIRQDSLDTSNRTVTTTRENSRQVYVARDSFALNECSEVCSQVATEPEFQPVSQEDFSLSTANVQDGARLDIVINGLWGEVRACFC